MSHKEGRVLQEYLEFKKAYPGFVIFYQLGDFFEVFFDDAKEVSQILSIALTSRDKNDPQPVPMCGVPVHSVASYVSKLLDRGLSVALVTQKKSGKNIERTVSQLLTPGVRVDLEADVNEGAVASIGKVQNHFQVSLAFVSDKTIVNKIVEDLTDVVMLLSTYGVQEMLIPSSQYDYFGLLLQNVKAVARRVQFEGSSFETLKKYLSTLNVHIDTNLWRVDNSGARLPVNAACLHSLDILNPESDQTLFNLLNQCVTPMGSAKLKQRFLSPFVTTQQIESYHNDLTAVLHSYPFYKIVQNAIRTNLNLSKIVLRSQSGGISLSEARRLKSLLVRIQEILKSVCTSDNNSVPKNAIQPLKKLLELKDSVERICAILDPLNDSTSSGLGSIDVFLPGHFPEFDELVSLKTQCDSILESMEKSEREKTGIPNLRVKTTQNFGIVIEITNSHKNLVPSRYIRKQTLVNCERFTSPELLELEGKIQNLDSQLLLVTEQIWTQMKDELRKKNQELDALSEVLGELDLVITLALVCKQEGFVRPKLVDTPTIKIREGFHPLLRRLLKENYQTNDFMLDQDNRFFILTGPNMGGKSSFLRQIGLTVILNQIGCFVPAREAELGVFDAVRVRIGANDQIFKGMSTFMSECVDIAEIARNAGPRTLVLIDELGRGTNAEEGLAFCVSILLFLAKRETPVVLATHFHQLSEIFPNARFIQTEVLETDTGPLFTHRIKEGVLNHSYSWFVVQKAGLPQEVVSMCKKYLNQYHNNSNLKIDIQECSEPDVASNDENEPNGYFDKRHLSVINALHSIDPNQITPREALETIFHLKELLSQEKPGIELKI